MIRSRCAILRGVSDPRRNLLTIALVTFCAAVLFGRLELGGVPAQAQTAALTALDYYEITPAPEGATGRVYLVQLGIRGPGRVDRHGGYEDVYVKTPEGWRIKSRTHVRNKAWHHPSLQTPDLN